MQLANVLGTVTATVKHSSLAGAKLLVVQPLLSDRTKADGDPQLAIDTVAAGVGDLVMITSDVHLPPRRSCSGFSVLSNGKV
jgi:ethanolamine utilization protein EutN